ncbi:MAG: 3-deoxy-D-manno-octulosonic acid transferase [Bacteroidales bacterium]|nr:3-deoxy-D-manno-octulosonic acid transferase [Bacteroidales bacterium]
MRLVYTLGVRLYALGVRLAALFGNAKAKLWVEGRKSQGSLRPVEGSKGPTDQWIWFHAASLGEFEQGRPVIEALKQSHPEFKILLSFFSPSGYEIRKNYPLADEVVYLPTDTPQHARQWVQSRHFVAAFFIKYEFWFNYMQALERADIPLFYISLILKPDSYFFRWYGSWFRKQLRSVRHFFVQDEVTAQLLKAHGMDNVTVCGDTRFDRVAAIAEQAKPFPEIERFVAGRQCIIAGSTWPPDEKLLAAFLSTLPEGYCMLIAPHDISAAHLAQIKAMLPEAQLYTDLCAEVSRPCHTEAQPSVSMGVKPTKNILVINTIGILSQLYQYARFVYIGGGFGVNIHNIQEPVTFGCPVVFGPRYKSFKEAVDLVALQGAFPVHDADELRSVFDRLMSDDGFHDAASKACSDYLKSQVGATKTIIKGFEQAFFL